MKKRNLIPIAVILFVLIVIIVFSKEKEIPVNEMEEEDTIQIGMSFDTFVIERWIRDRDVFVSTARELGAEVNVQNAHGDIEEQKKHIE